MKIYSMDCVFHGCIIVVARNIMAFNCDNYDAKYDIDEHDIAVGFWFRSFGDSEYVN